MALVILDSCQMETTTQGTGDYTVTAIADRDDLMTLRQHLSESNIADGDTIFLCIRQEGSPGGAEWGEYTFHDNDPSDDTLTRTDVIGSTDLPGGGAVNWGAGVKTVSACLIGDGGLILATNNGSDFPNAATFRTNLDLARLSNEGGDYTAATFRSNLAIPGLALANTFNGLQTFNGGSVHPIATLSDAATITWDALSDGLVAKVTLGADRTLGAISNVTPGMNFNLHITNGASWTLAYHANYKWPSGIAPVISVSGGITVISISAFDATNLHAVAALDFS